MTVSYRPFRLPSRYIVYSYRLQDKTEGGRAFWTRQRETGSFARAWCHARALLEKGIYAYVDIQEHRLSPLRPGTRIRTFRMRKGYPVQATLNRLRHASIRFLIDAVEWIIAQVVRRPA